MELSQNIIAIIDALAERFGIVIDWGAANVIPYLQELMERFIHYKTISTIVTMCIHFCVIIFGILVWIILWKIGDKYEDYDDDKFFWHCLGTIIGVCAIFVGVVCLIVYGYKLVELFTIPEKCIFDYLQSLN